LASSRKGLDQVKDTEGPARKQFGQWGNENSSLSFFLEKNCWHSMLEVMAQKESQLQICDQTGNGRKQGQEGQSRAIAAITATKMDQCS
jgi:hypothetical protein